MVCLWVRNEEKGSKGKLSSKLRSTHMVVWREWEAPVTWRLLPVTCYLLPGWVAVIMCSDSDQTHHSSQHGFKIKET